MPQAKTEVALQSSESCAAEIALQGKTPSIDSACADCPGFLVLGAAPAPASTFVSDPQTAVAFCFMGPWTFAWICYPQLPYHLCKDGSTAQVLQHKRAHAEHCNIGPHLNPVTITQSSACPVLGHFSVRGIPRLCPSNSACFEVQNGRPRKHPGTTTPGRSNSPKTDIRPTGFNMTGFIGHGEVRVYRGTGVSREVRRTTWERSLEHWELQIPCLKELFCAGNTLGLVPATLPHNF